jgi:outer membrane receptor for ferrienterochelin and colicin
LGLLGDAALRHVWGPRSIAIGIAATSLCAQAGHGPTPDPMQLSVEELMEARVYSASKFQQKTAEAPASVSVITADDIRAYGWRTLADILKSVRGFFVSNDRNYGYLGVRGFERPGDYNARVLLLVDGLRVNDTIYDTAGIQTEFVVDVDLIDRLEIVRGPGSAIYGSNAFFGVINVITRRGRDVPALEAAGEIASWNTDKERVTGGGRFDNGVEWLVSGSRYRSRGQDLYFAGWDSPSTRNGYAEGADGDEYQKALAKVSGGGLELTTAYSRREKQVPTASYGSVFGDPREQTVDQWGLVDLNYERALSAQWEVAPRVSYGEYEYRGDYPYGSGGTEVNRDSSNARWWSGEVKLAGRFERHQLITGVEYQDNARQDQLNYDEDPYTLYLDDRRSSRRQGVYIEDEITLARPLRASAGLRFDHYSTAGDALSPRAGIVWSPVESTTFKLLGGSAFRAPNNYELYYGDNSTNVPNPDLDPERISTYEAVAEHYLDANFRLTADLYYSRIHNLIEQVTDPGTGAVQFQNIGRVRGRGAEFELERTFRDDVRLRVSYAWQETRDLVMDRALTNSPRHVAKLNFATPVPGRLVNAGAELQYVGARTTLAGDTAGAYLVANLTLQRRLWGHVDISGSVYNLFDRNYADTARPEHEPQIDQIPQDGRNFRLKLAYAF